MLMYYAYLAFDRTNPVIEVIKKGPDCTDNSSYSVPDRKIMFC